MTFKIPNISVRHITVNNDLPLTGYVEIQIKCNKPVIIVIDGRNWIAHQPILGASIFRPVEPEDCEPGGLMNPSPNSERLL